MNFFDHKDLGNHFLQLCPKVVKHPVFFHISVHVSSNIASPVTACALSGHLRRVTYKEPDAVYIQYILLMMSTILLETCRGI